MVRVGVVGPAERLRGVLVALAASGTVDLGPAAATPDGDVLDAVRRLERADGPAPAATLRPERVDVAVLERDGRRDLLLGEAELAARAAGAVRHGSIAGLVGWAPAEAVPALAERLSAVGAVVVELPRPRASTPPTLLRPAGPSRSFQPLVEMYGPARYSDLDPTPFAAVAFVLMFGLMFGDAGHGLLLVAAGLLLRRTRWPRLERLRGMWPLPVACGVSATIAGLLYGEAFGPTGLVPTLWLDPTDEPVRLVGTAIGVGVVLLACGNVVGAVNRARAGARVDALVAPGGVAGLLVLAGAGLAVLAILGTAGRAAIAAAAVVALAGLGLVLVGLVRDAGPGATGAAEVTVGFFDAVVRLAGNAISFSRLAAFGLMHAVIAAVVLEAAAALAHGPAGWAIAVVVFALGNLLAFGVEGVVAGIQALRLEYYELFSRVFAGEGRRFAPWTLRVEQEVVA
jgi:V/A-type H+-transporting ATPase subunit I